MTSYPHHALEAGTLVSKWPGIAEVGDKVIIHSRGRYRQAIVEKVGPKRTTVAYTTVGAIESAQQFGHEPRVTRQARPHAEVYQQCAADAGPIDTRETWVIETSQTHRNISHRLEPYTYEVSARQEAYDDV